MSWLAIIIAFVVAFVIWSLSSRAGIPTERRFAQAVGKSQAERLIKRELDRDPKLTRKQAALRAWNEYQRDRR